MRVVGRAADKAFLDFEMDNALARQPSHDFLDFGHDLGADAVARKDKEIVASHVRLSLNGQRGGSWEAPAITMKGSWKTYAAASWRSTKGRMPPLLKYSSSSSVAMRQSNGTFSTLHRNI